MREVSSNAIRMLLEILAQAGIASEPLVRGLRVTLDDLRAPNHRIDWDLFAVLCDRAGAMCEGTLTLEQVGARLLVVPSFEFVRRAGQLVVTPRQLYTVAERMMAPALFPNLRIRNTWLTARRVVLVSEIAAEYRESVAFFRICHGGLVELPRLLGLPRDDRGAEPLRAARAAHPSGAAAATTLRGRRRLLRRSPLASTPVDATRRGEGAKVLGRRSNPFGAARVWETGAHPPAHEQDLIMTKKNSKKRAARVLQQKHGGSYQHHLRSIGGADGDGATPEAETEGILDPASHPVFMLKQLYEAAENILHEHPEGPSFLATVLAYTLPDRSTPFVPTVPTTAMNFIHDAPPLVLRGLARIR